MDFATAVISTDKTFDLMFSAMVTWRHRANQVMYMYYHAYVSNNLLSAKATDTYMYACLAGDPR